MHMHMSHVLVCNVYIGCRLFMRDGPATRFYMPTTTQATNLLMLGISISMTCDLRLVLDQLKDMYKTLLYKHHIHSRSDT
jgi:hypothetical protein